MTLSPATWISVLATITIACADPGPITPDIPVPVTLETGADNLSEILTARVTPGVTYFLSTSPDLVNWQTIETVRPLESLVSRGLFRKIRSSAGTSSLKPVQLQTIAVAGDNPGLLLTWPSLDELDVFRIHFLATKTLHQNIPIAYAFDGASHHFTLSRLNGSILGAPRNTSLGVFDTAMVEDFENRLTSLNVDAATPPLSLATRPQASRILDGTTRFWKLEKADNVQTDWDGDGSSNANELLQGTNPFVSDTDFDGYEDGQEGAGSGRDPKVNELISDVSALPPGLSTNLAVHYEFETRLSGNPNYFANLANSSYLARASGGTGSSADDGSLHKSATFAARLSDVLQITDGGPLFQTSSAFTMSFWFRMDTGAMSAGGVRGFFALRNINNAIIINLEAQDVSNQQVLAFSKLDGGLINNNILVPNTTDLDDGNWHHLVMLRNQTYTFYLNGQFLAQTDAFNPGVLPTPQLLLGSSNGGHFLGQIDRVLIYDSALSFSKIIDLYAWKKDDADGDGFTDAAEIIRGSNPRFFDSE